MMHSDNYLGAVAGLAPDQQITVASTGNITTLSAIIADFVLRKRTATYADIFTQIGKMLDKEELVLVGTAWEVGGEEKMAAPAVGLSDAQKDLLKDLFKRLYIRKDAKDGSKNVLVFIGMSTCHRHTGYTAWRLFVREFKKICGDGSPLLGWLAGFKYDGRFRTVSYDIVQSTGSAAIRNFKKDCFGEWKPGQRERLIKQIEDFLVDCK